MISKDSFVAIMEGIKDYDSMLHDLSDKGFIHAESTLWNVIDKVIDALAKDLEVEPTDDSAFAKSWEPLIYTYCFSRNYGQNYDSCDYLFMIDEVPYKPTTFEELYDSILELYYLTKGESIDVDETYLHFIRNMSREDLADAIINNDIVRMCCDDTKDCTHDCVNCMSAYLNKKVELVDLNK